MTGSTQSISRSMAAGRERPAELLAGQPSGPPHNDARRSEVQRKHDRGWYWSAVGIPFPRHQCSGDAAGETAHHRGKPEIGDDQTGNEHREPEAPRCGGIKTESSAENRDADE